MECGMRQWLLIIFLGLGLISMLACGALGAEPTTTAHGAANNAEGDAKHEEADSFPHPVISEDGSWAGLLVPTPEFHSRLASPETRWAKTVLTHLPIRTGLVDAVHLLIRRMPPTT